LLFASVPSTLKNIMTRNRKFIKIFLLAFIPLLIIFQGASGAEQSISVQAQVDREEVTVGESFMLQIKIDGDDSPAEPDLSGLQDFTVTPKGGGQNNRESITIINGRMNRISEHGYIFRYDLTPKRDGILTVPAIEVTAGGETLLTAPIPIRVAKPVVSDEFKLRISLAESESYVGQPLVLKVKWYVNRNIAEFKFDLPFLEDQRFTFADYPEDSNYQGQDAITINLSGSTVIARKGQEGQHTTVTLRKIVIPREPGEFTLGRGAVFSKIITGYRQKRGTRPFNDLFDDFFGGKQALYRQVVTESNVLHVKVFPLPDENRPVDFTGLVGQYSLAAEANPTEVNVGDPITLTIMVTGADYLDNVLLPPLENQPDIQADFKVPDEMGQGEIDGSVKVFTQTIRAKYPSVNKIPGISLSFFNPKAATYETTATKPIPLQVHATKIVTAKDAEGTSPGVAKRELTSLDKGITHNYVGQDILENQDFEIISWFGSPGGLILIIFPPAAYLLVLIPLYMKRKRLQDVEMVQAQKALPEFSKELQRLAQEIHRNDLQLTASGLVEAMRAYLSKRLFIPPGALVYEEVAARLKQHNVEDSLLAELKNILDWCEVYQYGAIDKTERVRGDIEEKLHTTSTLFEKIDRCLKKQAGTSWQ
jgi:hypothetical protein